LIKFNLRALSLFLALFLLSSCASTFRSWKAALTGEDTSQGRSPASSSSNNELSIDNRSGASIDEESDPGGPNLAQSELMSQSGHYDERAARGFRTGASPWRGTEPFNEGSLWNPDSQDGYLFSRNLLHKKGDIILVKLDPEVNDVLNEKITQMLGRSTLNQVIADEAGKSIGAEVNKKVATALGNKNIADAVGSEVANRTVSSIEGNNRYVDVDSIPVRIIEYLPRNTFAVVGSRRIYIKNAAYQLRLQGIVRDEDIGVSNAVSSNLVFESKLEIVK